MYPGIPAVPCHSSGEYMKELKGLLIGIVLLLLLLPVPVFAGDIPGPAGGISDPRINALSINPVITTAPPPVIINPRVVRTIITPQVTGVLVLESVPTHASVYIDGTLKGTTPLTLRTIATGIHEVTFSLSGYQNYTTKVTVTASAAATSYATLSPVITDTVTRTVSPSVSGTPDFTATTPQGTVITTSPVTTVSVPVTQETRQVTVTHASTCTRHYSGSAEMGTAPDGRLNCTIIISSDDRIMTLSVPEGTRVTDTKTRRVPEIRITPIIPSEIPSGTGPENSTWIGSAYHFLPDHTSFDPPVLISFTFGPAEWDLLDTTNLTIGETNETGQGWERLPTRIDPLARTLSAPVHHFSIIGLFSTSPAGNPLENLQSPITVLRAATGSNKSSLPLSSFIPDTYAPLAAVAAGITISIFGTLASGSKAVFRVWNKIIELIKKFLGSESIGLMSVTEIEKRGIQPVENLSAINPGLSSREILVITLMLVGLQPHSSCRTASN